VKRAPLSYRLASRVRGGIDLVRALYASAGTFAHRGVRFWHPGLLLDQQTAAALVDAAVESATKAGHDPKRLAALLARVSVYVTPDLPRLDGVAVDHFARWQGGIFDRGEVRLRYADDWPPRLAELLRALLMEDLAPDRARGGGETY